MKEFNNGITNNFYENTVADAKRMSDTDLLGAYSQCWDRPEPLSIAAAAIYKMEMIQREEAKKTEERKMKTTDLNYTIYSFNDMDVYTFKSGNVVNIYVKYPQDDEKMYFSFGVDEKDFEGVDIEKLHEVGYFNGLDTEDK